MTPIPMIGIRNSGRGLVELDESDGRLVVCADYGNGEPGDGGTVEIDLMDLIGWLSQNKELVMGLRETPGD